MRESGGYEELAVILGREFNAEMLAEGGRSPAQINGDVPYFATQDSDEFRLGVPDLHVETAKRSLPGERVVVLDEVLFDSGLRYFPAW